MKRTLLLYACALCAFGALATVPVFQITTSEQTTTFQLEEIDSIVFSPAADYLYVNYSGDKQKQFATPAVEQMNYAQLDDKVSVVWSNDGTVTITNPLSSIGVDITANGADVTITNTYLGEVSYNLSGTSADGSLKIYSDYKYELVLNGLTLTNIDGPAINSQ